MRDYGTLSTSFWTVGKGRQLRGDVTALAIAPYVFACPHGNMIGLFYLSPAYVADDFGIPFEGASKGLRRVSAAGLMAWDEDTNAVFVFGAAKRNLGETLKPKDNRTKHLRDLLHNAKKHPFYRDFLTKYGTAYGLQDLLSDKPLGSPLEAPSKLGTGTGTGTPTESRAPLQGYVDIFWELTGRKDFTQEQWTGTEAQVAREWRAICPTLPEFHATITAVLGDTDRQRDFAVGQRLTWWADAVKRPVKAPGGSINGSATAPVDYDYSAPNAGGKL